MYYAMIMAGGSGTRLWPFSRLKHPKQALKMKLIGERTMFQHAVDRLLPIFPPDHILVVAGADHAPLLSEQAPELPLENFLIEPEGRGTAPAIGLATVHIHRRNPDAVMAVVTADHFIRDTAVFQRTLSAAYQAAQTGCLVTLGIQPDYPATGYGYIQAGARLGEYQSMPLFQVESFVEKPNLERAEQMLAAGGFSWNSGMFIWKTSRIMQEFQHQMPDLHACLAELTASLDAGDYPTVLRRAWPLLEKQTIDYGVMEGAQQVAVIPVEMGWTDIGSWRSVCELLPPDEQDNSFTGPHVALDTTDTLVFSDTKLVATVGLHGMVVVVTDDAVLICPKEREQEVRSVVRWLREHGGDEWL